jgi:hypothetical protein
LRGPAKLSRPLGYQATRLWENLTRLRAPQLLARLTFDSRQDPGQADDRDGHRRRQAKRARPVE